MAGNAARHDAWQAGDSYDLYMGRWSRRIAPLFLDWLKPARGLDWLDVGCGTGSLSQTILARTNPRSVVGVDPSETFVAKARGAISDNRADFKVGSADALPLPDASRHVAASSLVLNFVPDRAKALAEMKRVTRRGGSLAFYVWDYPGGGVSFIRAFWNAAKDLDPSAADLAEDRRFPFCTPDSLLDLVREAGLGDASCTRLETTAVFRDFDDLWRPFTLGAGPAPGYCAGLSPEAQARLRARLFESVPRQPDGTIAMPLAAWAVSVPA